MHILQLYVNSFKVMTQKYIKLSLPFLTAHNKLIFVILEINLKKIYSKQDISTTKNYANRTIYNCGLKSRNEN